MPRHQDEQQIARDLELCDLVSAIGTKSARAKARKHRRSCMDQIRQWNKEDGLDNMTDDEILADLLADH